MQNQSKGPRLWTVSEVAARLRKDPVTIRRAIHGREVQAFLVGGTYRFEISDLRRWIGADRAERLFRE